MWQHQAESDKLSLKCPEIINTFDLGNRIFLKHHPQAKLYICPTSGKELKAVKSSLHFHQTIPFIASWSAAMTVDLTHSHSLIYVPGFSSNVND